MQALLIKAAIVALGSGVAWILIARRLHESLSEKQFVLFCIGLTLALRCLLFIGIYVVAGKEVTSDVPGYYVPGGHAVLQGGVPYLDFDSSYAPLFSYVSAGLLYLYDSPKIFVLFDIALDVLSVLLWYSAAKTTHTVATARAAAVLYACSGALLVQCLLGTNQQWIGFANAAAIYLLCKRRDALSGVVQGIALGSVKLLALLSWPVLWLSSQRRAVWTLGAIVTALAIYLPFVGMHADILRPLKFEAQLITAGNLPYLLQPALQSLGVTAWQVDVATACALLGVIAWLMLQRARVRPQFLLSFAFAALPLLQVALMLFSKKSFPAYFVFAAFPAWLLIVERLRSPRGLLFFALFNLLMALESSVWFWLGGNGLSLMDWLNVASPDHVAPLVLVDGALIACYGYLAYLAVDSLRGLAERSRKVHSSSEVETLRATTSKA